MGLVVALSGGLERQSLPLTISDVTAEWLNAALAGADEWCDRTVESVTFTPISGDDALASAVFVGDITVVADRGVSEAAQLLVKLHHPDPGQRSAGSYAAEAWFYRLLASRAGTPVPRTFVAEADECDGRLIIVQEFLRDGSIGSAGNALGVGDMERVLSSLAALHAAWWRSAELCRMSKVRTFEPVIRNAIVNLRSGALDVHAFLDRYGDLLDPSVARSYVTMPGWMEQVADGFSAAFTLIHLDCSAKNVFIPRDPGRDPVLFDWALFRRGNPGLDVATLLAYSMDPAEHHRLRDLVRRYHERLLEKGVDDYAFDALWDDVRYGILWRMMAPVFNAAVGTPAREAHARTILPLLDSALRASGAIELIVASAA